MNRPIYITGHKNPDTDSIVSAIAYAEYKKAKGENVLAGRIGPVAADTEYLLERFSYEDPIHLYSGKCTIADIDYDAPGIIDPDLTINEALNKVVDTSTRTLFVTDRDRKLLGVLSLSNLSNFWVADDRRLAKMLRTATLENIIKILRGKLINKASGFHTNGRVELAPFDDDVIHKNDIVITSSPKRFSQAVKAQAGLIIIVGDEEKFAKKIIEAIKEDISVISTKLQPLKISKLIYQTPAVREVMIDEKEVVKVFINETVDACLNKISKSRYRSYPILDENGEVLGALSRYHLFNYQKKQFILVDHNEVKQSIDDLDSAEVIEVVDHHRFGGFESTNPISITTRVVGATATIIASRFIEENIEISMELAGLLLGAILSDTMNFASPTTTDIDREVAKKLEEIAEVDADELYAELIKHGESLRNRKTIDILYDDYKNYEINGIKVGISQATCKDKDEYKAVRDSLINVMNDACKSRGLDLMVCMLTDPSGSGSYLLTCGEYKDVINEMYPNRKEDDFVSRLMSRKKQLLPEVIRVLS